MKFFNTMLRVKDMDANIEFFGKLGLTKIGGFDNEELRYSVSLLGFEGVPMIGLTHNWGQPEPFPPAPALSWVAFHVDNVYETYDMLIEKGITVNRPPHDGTRLYIYTPEGVRIAMGQDGDPLPIKEPYASLKIIKSPFDQNISFKE